MAIDFKDYYETLGVTRDASETEIKQAFRKLARQFHPDVAKDKKTAEAKFKEINEAHEVLSDPEKRKKYDALGADWQNAAARGAADGTRWRTAPGREQEVHFGGTGFSDFFEQFFGGGRGTAAGFDDILRGAGSARSGAAAYRMPGSDIEGDIMVTLDEALHGASRSISLQRVNPESGETETETFTVRIPPGATEGRRIRARGKGGRGIGGAEPGDLILRVRLAAHPDFEPRGSDLYHELAVAPWEAVLGAQVTVPTLTGTVKLRIPPGTGSGRQLRIRGQGLPREKSGERGDLFVTVKIDVPTTLASKEHALWEELARTSTFNPRQRAS